MEQCDARFQDAETELAEAVKALHRATHANAPTLGRDAPEGPADNPQRASVAP